MGHIELIGEQRNTSQHIGSDELQGLDDRLAGAARGYEILDDDRLLSFADTAFDLIAQSVGFGLAADIGHGHIQAVGHPCGVGDARGGGSRDHIHVGIGGADVRGHLVCDPRAQRRVEHGQAIVAVNG